LASLYANRTPAYLHAEAQQLAAEANTYRNKPDYDWQTWSILNNRALTAKASYNRAISSAVAAPMRPVNANAKPVDYARQEERNQEEQRNIKAAAAVNFRNSQQMTNRS
jgi:hypothetical protein